MNDCDDHRKYLAALADGELSLVPPATVEHVNGCVACGHEVDSHKRLAVVLRQALVSHRPAFGASPLRRRSRSRRVAGLMVVAAATAAAIAIVLARFAGGSAPDPVAFAFASSQKPAQLASTSINDVSAWCARAAGRPMPLVALDRLSVVGARSDQSGGLQVITIDYRNSAGQLVTISWMQGATRPTTSAIQLTSAIGLEALIVSTPADEALISGTAPMSALWQAAAQLEATG